MATAKKDNPPRNFTGLLDDVPATQPAQAAPTGAQPAKGPIITFHIDADLKQPLDQLVYWSGRKGSQRAVLNKALRALLESDPRSRQPIPGDE